MTDTIKFPIRTSQYLTKYECARLIGLRLLQLQNGIGVKDPWSVAMQELREKKNPAVLRRYMPDGSFEDVTVSALKLNSHLVRYQLTPFS